MRFLKKFSKLVCTIYQNWKKTYEISDKNWKESIQNWKKNRDIFFIKGETILKVKTNMQTFKLPTKKQTFFYVRESVLCERESYADVAEV